jgi:hypothetical protein
MIGGDVGSIASTLREKAIDPGFQQSTTQTEQSLQSVSGAIDTRHEKIIRSGNPSDPMTGVDPPIFGARPRN